MSLKGTLITDIEYDLVVGWQTVVQPLDFGSGSFHGLHVLQFLHVITTVTMVM